MKTRKEFKLIRLILLLMLIFSFLFSIFTNCLGQGEESEKAFVSPTNLFPKVEEIAGIGAKFDQKRDQYLRERGWVLGQSSVNFGGAYIGWGVGSIKLKPDDTKYGQARIAAFYRAYADAKGEFVKFRQQEFITEMAREFYLNDLPDIEIEIGKRAYLQERISILAEKALDLGEGYLNRLLRDLNIDPDQYRIAEKGKKESILYDAISLRNTRKAVSSLSGVRILMNFDDLDSVGVLIAYNEKSEEIARQIARGDMISRRPSELVTSSIIKQLEKSFMNDEDYIKIQGVRIMEDESGEKVLVSFGQWAPEITNVTSSQLRQARFQAAATFANSNAMAELTNFINSTMVFEETTEMREIDDINRLTLGKRVEEISSYNIGHRVEDIINQYGRVKLEGVTIIKEWSANDPKTGHIIVGCVLMWSPSTRDAALGIITSPVIVPEGKIKYDEEVRESPPLDHLDPTLQP